MSKGKTFICLRTMISFFARTKNVNHMSPLLVGLKGVTYPTLVIVKDKEAADTFRIASNKNDYLQFMLLREFMMRDSLRDHRDCAIVFDPEVINIIAQKYESRIELLCNQNSEWKRRASAASQLLNGQWPKNCQDDYE